MFSFGFLSNSVWTVWDELNCSFRIWKFLNIVFLHPCIRFFNSIVIRYTSKYYSWYFLPDLNRLSHSTSSFAFFGSAFLLYVSELMWGRCLETVAILMAFGCVAEDKEVTIVRLEDGLDAERSVYIYIYVCKYYVIHTFFHYQEKNSMWSMLLLPI